MTDVAIIGTAGRDKKRPITAALYHAMVQDALAFCKGVKNIRLRSGGAAGADQVAIDVASRLGCPIWLDLPAEWDVQRARFVDGGKGSPGQISNYYHSLFHKMTGVDGLRSLHNLVLLGRTTSWQGFHSRNSRVGQVDIVRAYTWGEGAVPADGGTAHTWRQSSAPQKIHVPLASIHPAVLADPLAPPVFLVDTSQTYVWGFQGLNRVLSNFDTTPLRIAVGYIEELFKSAEHAYQWAKWASRFPELGLAIRQAPEPKDAKRLGTGRPHGWEQRSLDVFRAILAAKFQTDSAPGRHLGQTGSAVLVEFNTWGDTFFGVVWDPAQQCFMGHNWLGRLLMERRAQLHTGDLR